MKIFVYHNKKKKKNIVQLIRQYLNSFSQIVPSSLLIKDRLSWKTSKVREIKEFIVNLQWSSESVTGVEGPWTSHGKTQSKNQKTKKSCLVNLSSSYVIITGQLDIQKALIVSKIQVHLSIKKTVKIHNFFFL